jgi:thiol-disulfide isomerase/thioredoxin
MSHFRIPLRRAVSALLIAGATLVGATLVGAALPANGQETPSDSVLRGFQQTGTYILLINGQVDAKAEVYINESLPAYLVLPSKQSPILITPRAGTVETVQMLKVARQKDGTVDLLADAVLNPQGKFTLSGERVDFSSEGKKLNLAPKPPLLGLKKAADLKAHSPEYVRSAKTYTPNAQSLAALKKHATPVRVLVFFGSWCPHCKEMLPHLLRVQDEIQGAKIQFDYRGISKDFKDPEVLRLKIGEVPTAVVYVNGQEIGRLTKNDWLAPEVALSRLLGGPKTGK